MPWLAIAGAGSPAGRLQDFVDYLLWYRVRLEFPDRAPGSDALVNFHPCILSRLDLGGNNQIAYLKSPTYSSADSCDLRLLRPSCAQGDGKKTHRYRFLRI
jgi:hypothetical protein